MIKPQVAVRILTGNLKVQNCCQVGKFQEAAEILLDLVNLLVEELAQTGGDIDEN